MRKNIIIVFLVVFSLLGCSKKTEEITENTQTETNVPTENKIVGTYIEKADNYPSTIILNDDGTFSSSLNICAGMSEIKGTYIVEDTKVILDFPTKTGIQFIDEGQPFIFNITDDELTLDASNDFFSCSYVNVFKLKQGE